MRKHCLKLGEERKDFLTDALLKFMYEEAELCGSSLNNIWFDFTPSYVVRYFNAPDETIADGESLAKFKQILNVSDDEILSVIRSCLTNEYIKQAFMGRETESIQLTSQGRARAKSVKKAVNYQPTPTIQYNINAPVNNSAIGENSQVNINNSIETLLNLIETAKATIEEKNDAKSKFLEFLKHPVIAPILSACGIQGVQALKGLL